MTVTLSDPLPFSGHLGFSRMEWWLSSKTPPVGERRTAKFHISVVARGSRYWLWQ